jgi:hypothetical protein
MPPTPDAEARIHAALEKIQRAQRQVGEALADLSALRGVAPAYRNGLKLHDRVRKYWYEVAGLLDRRGRLQTDRE